SFRLYRVPLVRPGIVEPDVATAVGEERLFPGGNVDKKVAKAALRASGAGARPIPAPRLQLEKPGTGVPGRRLQPALSLGDGCLPIGIAARDAQQSLRVRIVGAHLVTVAQPGHGSRLTVGRRLEAIRVDLQIQLFDVGAGITADPAVAVDVVEP